MAMNEDSVVASLNELRQMANDRARRETAARARVEDRGSWDSARGQGGRSSDGRIRVSDAREIGPRPTAVGGYDAQQPSGYAPTLVGGYGSSMGGQPAAAQAPGYGYGYGYSHAVQSAAMPEVPSEPIKQKSSFGAVFLTILVMGGAAAGGYWKLQQDWNATLRARDIALQQAEEGRMKAVEAAAKAEQRAKLAVEDAEKAKLSEKEAAAKVAAAPVPAAPTAAPAAPASKPVVAAKPSKSDRNSRRGRRAAAAKKAVARVEKLPPAPPPVAAPKPVAMPKLVGKKGVPDDPLAGLKL